MKSLKLIVKIVVSVTVPVDVTDSYVSWTNGWMTIGPRRIVTQILINFPKRDSSFLPFKTSILFPSLSQRGPNNQPCPSLRWKVSFSTNSAEYISNGDSNANLSFSKWNSHLFHRSISYILQYHRDLSFLSFQKNINCLHPRVRLDFLRG